MITPSRIIEFLILTPLPISTPGAIITFGPIIEEESIRLSPTIKV